MGDKKELNEDGKKIRELREKTGMSRKDFCEYFGIPVRTMEDWEHGRRSMPEYLLRLMAYKVEMEKLIKKGDSENEKKKE